jgi:hypothetical protein
LQLRRLRVLDAQHHLHLLRTPARAAAADWGSAEIIEPDREPDVAFADADAIRDVEADPAEIGHLGFGPGMPGLLVDDAVRAAQIAGDVARG